MSEESEKMCGPQHVVRRDRDAATRILSCVALAAAIVGVAPIVAPLGAQGTMRELGCRGGPGLALRVETDPSPRDAGSVVERMDYRVSTKAVGYDLRALDPGTCTWNPTRAEGYPPEPGDERVSWGDGKQWLDLDLKSTAEVPDQFRMLVDGNDDDHDISVFGREVAPRLTCARPNRAPGKTASEEWTSLIMDFDLTKYPGAKNGESFVRRAQPLRGRSTLLFEIRGSILVTRQ